MRRLKTDRKGKKVIRAGNRKSIQCTHCKNIYYFYGAMCKCKCPKCKGKGHKLLAVEGKQEI